MKSIAVILVPGISGSKLHLDGQPFWPPSVFSLPNFIRDLPKLKMPTTNYNVSAPEVVDEIIWVGPFWRQSVYGRLTQFLVGQAGFSKGVDLFECPYDWRLPIQDSAQTLAQKVGQLKNKIGLNGIVLICHSMGGLVAQYCVRHYLSQGDIMCIIMLGTPNLGAPEAFDRHLSGWYFGNKGLIRAIQSKLSPFRQLYDSHIRATLETFPSIYQLLPRPNEPCVLDCYGHNVDIYSDTGWLPSSRLNLLANATNFWLSMPGTAGATVVHIAGDRQRTTIYLRQRTRHANRWNSLRVERGYDGDGTVPFHSASPPGVYPQPYGVGHGDLYVHPDIQDFLKRYLQTLEKAAVRLPAATGGRPQPPSSPPGPPTATGGGPQPPPLPPAPPSPCLNLRTNLQVYTVNEPILVRGLAFDGFGAPIMEELSVQLNAAGAGKDYQAPMQYVGGNFYRAELPGAPEEGDIVITAMGEGPKMPKVTGVTSVGVVSAETESYLVQELPTALQAFL